jgi:hypothetical protein
MPVVTVRPFCLLLRSSPLTSAFRLIVSPIRPDTSGLSGQAPIARACGLGSAAWAHFDLRFPEAPAFLRATDRGIPKTRNPADEAGLGCKSVLEEIRGFWRGRYRKLS